MTLEYCLQSSVVGNLPTQYIYLRTTRSSLTLEPLAPKPIPLPTHTAFKVQLNMSLPLYIQLNLHLQINLTAMSVRIGQALLQ